MPRISYIPSQTSECAAVTKGDTGRGKDSEDHVTKVLRAAETQLGDVPPRGDGVKVLGLGNDVVPRYLRKTLAHCKL